MKCRNLLWIVLWSITVFTAGAGNGNSRIRTGAEQMEKWVPMLKGKNVALVVNQTSTVGQTHLFDTLYQSGVRVSQIFAPEHGFRGNADAGETVKNHRDVRTGVPVTSLYGKNKKPTPAQLQQTDVVIFDIQDVGDRKSVV